MPESSAERETRRPGSVNAHTHLYSGLAPLGMPPPPRRPGTFVEILQLVWWRLDRALDEASLRAAARLYIAEALLAGTTTIIDHHESPNFIEGSLDVLAEEGEALGARLVLTYGATERNGGRDEARRGLAECARFIRAARFPRAKGLVGLHASFTVGDDTVREAGELARALHVPLHLHVAEAESDVDDARGRGYDGPLERVAALGALAAGSILAHGVWLDSTSVRRAEEAGAWLVQNPRSNVNNGVGYPRALQASGHVALGTDGFPSNLDDEERALLEAADRNGDPRDRATLAGVRQAGLRLAASFDGGALSDHVVGAAGGRPRTVVVDGQTVVEDGRLVRADLEEIRAHAGEQARRLWSRTADLAEQ
jgi:cytosine/adenosine deaminase-related metal-dependent hydrolase